MFSYKFELFFTINSNTYSTSIMLMIFLFFGILKFQNLKNFYFLVIFIEDSDFWTVFYDSFLDFAPKKPNWDLQRDVQKKIDKLEKRNQKVIFQLMGMLYSHWL